MSRILAVAVLLSMASICSATPPTYVAVAYDPVGQILTLNGDSGPNSLQLTTNGTLVTVKAGSPTRLGTASSNAQTFTFRHGGNLTIRANMGGGSDLVVINGLSIQSGTFDLGSDNDVLTFASCRFGNVSVNGGSGWDSVRFLSSPTVFFSWWNVESLAP